MIMTLFRYLCLTSGTMFVIISCSANEVAQTQCDSWYQKTIQEVDSFTSPQKSFRHLLGRISTGCEKIPLFLRTAAGEAAAAPEDSEFGLYWPLLNAAKSYFPEICEPSTPDEYASGLAQVCLGDDDKSDPVLRSLDTATYL